jgi:FKBP-type peptidyl-prolyl cis-trans isomerase 2
MRRLLLAAAFVAAASTAVLAQRPGRPHLQVDVTKSVICPLSEKAAEGDKVTVHYGGFLMDGKKFDSSFDRAKPFTFDLGVGQVIPGWDQGLIGVCKNEERHLVVPASLAYGDRGAGDVIPAGATLLFDIVVVDVQKIKSAADVRQEEEDTRRKAAAEADRRQREEEDKKRVEDNRRRDEEDRRRAEAAEAEADRRRQQDEDDNKRRRQDAADRRRQQEEDDNKRRKQGS